MQIVLLVCLGEHIYEDKGYKHNIVFLTTTITTLFIGILEPNGGQFYIALLVGRFSIMIHIC